MQYDLGVQVLAIFNLCNFPCGWGKSKTGTGIFRVKAAQGPGEEVYNKRIYTVVWLNNLQPAEM